MASVPARLGLLLPLLAAFSGCGPPERTTEEWLDRLHASDSAIVRSAVDALARKAREDPEVLRRLVAEFVQEMSWSPTITVALRADFEPIPPEERAEAARAFDSAVHGRAVVSGIGSMVDLQGGGRALIRIPRPSPEPTEEWKRRVLADLGEEGRMEVSRVVPPPGEGDGPPPAPGAAPFADAAAHEAFRRDESARREAARAEGRRHEPSRAGLRVLADPTGEERVLADAPATARVFERNSSPASAVGPRNQTILAFSVVESVRDGLEAWTREHLGSELALVVDDRVEGILRLDEPRRHSLEFTLLGDPEAARSRARRLELLLPCGRLPPGTRASFVPHRPTTFEVPISYALVTVGPPAIDALADTEQAGGAVGEAARWVREEILRRASRPPLVR